MLTLASLNLRWSLHIAGGTIALAPVLRELDADVVLLQEVWQRRGGQDTLAPARELGYAVAEIALSRRGVLATRGFADGPAGAEGSWGLAVLSRRRLLNQDAITLGAVPLDPVGARAALRVTVAGESGSSLSVVNVHLSHRPYGSVLQLRRLVRVLAAAGAPLAIGGDFNMFGLVSRAVLAPLRRTVPAPSWPARRPRVGLDQIFVAPDVDVLAAAVCGEVGSDHRPVRATVRFTPRR